MKKIILFISQCIVACAVLGWEHTFSLPILFFALVLLFFEWQPPLYRQVLLVLLSIAFASLYQISFALSILLFVTTVGGYLALGRWLHVVGLKVAVISVVASGVIAVVTHLQFSTATLVISLISVALMVGLTKLIQFESRSEFLAQETMWTLDRD